MKKSEQTRTRLVEAAAGLFNTKGYAAASLADLTEATGLTKGSMYANFGSKEELMLEAFNHSARRVWSAQKLEMALETTNVGKLRACLRYYKYQASRPPVPGGCPLLNAATEADDSNPALAEQVRNAVNYWRRSLVRMFMDAQDAGEIQTDENPWELATWWIATIEGAVMLARLYADAEQAAVGLNRLSRHLDSICISKS